MSVAPGQAGTLRGERIRAVLVVFIQSAAARILPLASRARLDKEQLPDVLAVAGTSVRAFRKPETVGDHSFQDIRMDCSKGKKTHRLGGLRQGSFGLPDGLDPVRDCRRPSRNLMRKREFLQRLIVTAR